MAKPKLPPTKVLSTTVPDLTTVSVSSVHDDGPMMMPTLKYRDKAWRVL